MDVARTPIGSQPQTAGVAPAQNFRIHVIFTSPISAAAAIQSALAYAANLGADLSIVVPHLVPYPLPLSKPAVHPEFLERKYATAIGALIPEAGINICYCRTRLDGLQATLPKHSIAVIGMSRPWWPINDFLLARRLRLLGHRVIIATVRRAHA